MAIVMTVDKHDFIDAFKRRNRQDQFSYEGLEVLFDYLEEYSDCTGEPVEMDVIALCCEYYESSVEELIEQYRGRGISADDLDDASNEEEIKTIVEEFCRIILVYAVKYLTGLSMRRFKALQYARIIL